MEARYWHREDDGGLRCDLCPHGCLVGEGREGRCRVRGVRGGRLQALAYGHIASAGNDPIEKKPLYHFFPGRFIFSVGGWGCNFTCRFCQNWSISQTFREGTPSQPACIVDAACRNEGGQSSVGMAYTYNEPLVGYEFVYDCAVLARERGLKNVLVTNGFINPEPAAALLPLIDALNIDIKSMDPAFYREQCGGELAPVLAFARQANEAGCHVEITNLVIPSLNDAAAGFEALATWIADNLGRGTPLHLSAYRPEFKTTLDATPTRMLRDARAVCRGRLDYVYLGNTVAEEGRDTVCPGCNHPWIRRAGYRAAVVGLTPEGTCASCGRPAGILC